MTTGPANLHLRGLRRGFTFVEMSISLVVMTIIAGALAGIIGAVGITWRSSEDTQAALVSGRQASVQLYRLLRSAKYVGMACGDDQQVASGVVTPSAGSGGAILFWKEDDGDQRMQLCEIALIEHDRSASTLILHQVPKTAPNASTVYSPGDTDESSDASALKALATVRRQVIARNIRSARFVRSSPGGLPECQAVEFAMGCGAEGKPPRTEYGTAALRGSFSPKTP